MKCCGTDSATVKAASKEGVFLMQIEVLSSSGVISTSHEAQSIFSARPNPGPMAFCHNQGRSTLSDVSWAILGPRCCMVMASCWKNLPWSAEENKDRAMLALRGHFVPVPWVLWVHPCIHPQQRGPAAAYPAPHTILIEVFGVQRGRIPAAKPLCAHSSSGGLWHLEGFFYSQIGSWF